MPNPTLLAMEVTTALKRQIEAIEELAKYDPPSYYLTERVVEATGVLTLAWEAYLKSLDPKGWGRAKELLSPRRSAPSSPP